MTEEKIKEISNIFIEFARYIEQYDRQQAKTKKKLNKTSLPKISELTIL